MLTIHTCAFNEDHILQFMINHYRARFPSVHFKIFDNQSTDQTRFIAEKCGCEVIDYNTSGELDDMKLINLKNNCWKNSKTNWVLVVDPDELLEITEDDLKREEKLGTTIISVKGFDMVNMNDDFNLKDMKFGNANHMYDKKCLFNKTKVREIDYIAGAHVARPRGEIKFSEKEYRLLHWRYLNPEFTIKRYQLSAQRMSAHNIQTKMGDFVFAPEEKIRADYEEKRKTAVRLIP